jgi:hypothetical protein
MHWKHLLSHTLPKKAKEYAKPKGLGLQASNPLWKKKQP